MIVSFLTLHTFISNQHEVNNNVRRGQTFRSRRLNTLRPLVVSGNIKQSKAHLVAENKTEYVKGMKWVSAPPRTKPLQAPIKILHRNQSALQMIPILKELGPIGLNLLQKDKISTQKPKVAAKVVGSKITAKDGKSGDSEIFKPPKCNPKSKIIHMEGYSNDGLLSKLLFTFALRHKLSVLPFNDAKDHLVTDVVMDQMLHLKLPTSNTQFDIISKQFVLNDGSIKQYSDPHSTIIMSIGDPAEHYLSILQKMKYSHESLENVLLSASYLTKQLVARIKLGEKNKPMGENVISEREEQWLRNSIYRQLGFVHKYVIFNVDERVKFHKNLKRIMSTIGLFFLKNRFDESLLRLRRKLCWSYKDILYLHRPGDFVYVKDKKASEALASIEFGLNTWSHLDFKIQAEIIKSVNSSKDYNNLNTEFGHFRLIREKVQSFCERYKYVRGMTDLSTNATQILFWFKRIRIQSQSLSIPESEWHPTFQVSPTDCVIMNMDTLVLRNLNRARAIPYLCKELWQPNAAEGIQKLRKYSILSFDRNVCSLIDEIDKTDYL